MRGGREKGTARREAGWGSMVPVALSLCVAVLRASGAAALLLGGRSSPHQQLTRRAAATREFGNMTMAAICCCIDKQAHLSQRTRARLMGIPEAHRELYLPVQSHQLFAPGVCNCEVGSFISSGILAFSLLFFAVNHIRIPCILPCRYQTAIPLVLTL